MKVTLSDGCNLSLPQWVQAFVSEWPAALASPEECMALAVALSAENVSRGTGGPFGAIVVSAQDWQLLSVGLNLVTELNLSMAHAEMVALTLAQTRMAHWNLGRDASTVLVSSCEPCAMCFGAIPWSGVSSLLCGARKSDAENAGFDEGDKPADWQHNLEARGISVRRDVLREEAATVLQAYASSAGEIYNP